MRLKEHQPECGCASCQNQHQQPVDNIDGYASGFELAPDPNQELTPELMGDPDFITNVINQVLQQMQTGGGDIDEQLVPPNQFLTQLPDMEKQDFGPDSDWIRKKNYMAWKYAKHNPCPLKRADMEKMDKYIDLGSAGPSGLGGFGGTETELEMDPYQNQMMSEDKIREYIKSQVKSLQQEGSCGHNQSAPDGKLLKSPGGTVGMDAQTRTNKMKPKKLKEKGQGWDNTPTAQTWATYKGPHRRQS
jgi:hypothetical protein